MGAGDSLRRDVACHSRGAASLRRLRLRCERDPGVDAVGREASVAGGPLTYGLLLGAFGVGAVAGALQRRAIARDAVDRGDRALGWLRTCAAPRRSSAVSTHLALTMAALLLGRRRLGAEPFDFQRHRAVVRTALGRRARVVALSDGCIRRHGSRQLAVGRSCRGRRHQRIALLIAAPSCAGLRSCSAAGLPLSQRASSISIRCGTLERSQPRRCRSRRARARS